MGALSEQIVERLKGMLADGMMNDLSGTGYGFHKNNLTKGILYRLLEFDPFKLILRFP